MTLRDEINRIIIDSVDDDYGEMTAFRHSEATDAIISLFRKAMLLPVAVEAAESEYWADACGFINDMGNAIIAALDAVLGEQS